MKILVTGGAGFIGSHIVDDLLKKGHSVVVADDLSTGQNKNIAHNKRNKNFQFIKVNVANYSELESSIDEVDIIINLVAHKIPKFGDATKVLLVNSYSAANVLDLARKMDAKVIMVSSSDVYGKSDAQPLKEDGDLLLGPSDIKRWSYSVSKVFDEQLTVAYGEDYDLKYVILRYFGVYGPRMHPSWRAGPQSTFIDAAIKDEKFIIHGDGEQKRTFCYVDEIVDGTIRSMENSKAEGEIINLGSNQEISILKLAKLINLLNGDGIDNNIEFIPHQDLFGKYEEIFKRMPDLTKAKELLDWEPRIGLEDGLTRTIQWRYGDLNISSKIDVKNIEAGLVMSFIMGN
jgi:UDP-glucose 4-epimerase